MKVPLYMMLVFCMVVIMTACAHATDKIASASDDAIVKNLVAIQNKYGLSDKKLFYFEIDVVKASMDVYQLVFKEDSNYFLELISSHRVGTPKVSNYPCGFGVITKVERNPIWAPTPDTVKEFKKRGINLAKFKNKAGKIIIPPGNPLNYMGPIKMSISFITPQKSAKTRREVYRIHGTLPQHKKKLGTRCSGGCTRVDNSEIEELAKITRNGSIIVQYI